MSPHAHPYDGIQVREFVINHHDTYHFIEASKADLSGRSVFITGASKGVGKATAISFAEAGASYIAISARSPLDEVETAVKAAAARVGRPEPKVLALKIDVTNEASVADAAEAVGNAFGGALDVCIANAGFLEPWKPIVDSSPDTWWTSWEVNVRGAYLTAKYFLPLLRRSATGAPTLIVMSSVGAHMIAPGAAAYQTNKMAVCRLVEFLDAENGKDGLVAMAVHPGAVATELALRMPESMHELLIDTPELAGDTFVWLAKEKRAWLAGRYVSVPWDMQELEKRKEEIVEGDLLKFRMVV